MLPDAVVLRPIRAGFMSRGRTAFSHDRGGFIDGAGESGLWVCETRLLCSQRWLINERPGLVVTASMLSQDEWLGYFIAPPPGSDHVDPAQQTLEFRLRRSVGEGLREEVLLTNFAQSRMVFELTLDIDADFQDWNERAHRRHRPVITRACDQDCNRVIIQGRAHHVSEEYGEQVVRRTIPGATIADRCGRRRTRSSCTA